MAGLVPAIHVFEIAMSEDVDARHKAGHDGSNRLNRDLSVESFRRHSPGPRDDSLVGLRQRLARIAKPVGDRIAAVAAKVLARDLHTGRRLPPLVFGDV